MEMMILSILSPILMCQWGLQNYEEALITTVSYVAVFCIIIIGIVSKYSSLIRPANSFHIRPENRYFFPNSSNKFVLHLKKIIQKSKIHPEFVLLMIKKFVPYSFSKDKIRSRFVWTKFVHDRPNRIRHRFVLIKFV